jgi:hypothetical protein
MGQCGNPCPPSVSLRITTRRQAWRTQRIANASEQALSRGTEIRGGARWLFTKSRRHAFGRFRCGHGHPRVSDVNLVHARQILKIIPGLSVGRSIAVREFPMKNPEFYLILAERDLHEDLENAVFEAGFDDSELTVRGDHAAICDCHRNVRAKRYNRHATAVYVFYTLRPNAIFVGPVCLANTGSIPACKDHRWARRCSPLAFA